MSYAVAKTLWPHLPWSWSTTFHLLLTCSYYSSIHAFTLRAYIRKHSGQTDFTVFINEMKWPISESSGHSCLKTGVQWDCTAVAAQPCFQESFHIFAVNKGAGGWGLWIPFGWWLCWLCCPRCLRSMVGPCPGLLGGVGSPGSVCCAILLTDIRK